MEPYTCRELLQGEVYPASCNGGGGWLQGKENVTESSQTKCKSKNYLPHDKASK